MSSGRIKRAILAGWDEMSDSYQAEIRVSLDDVHYGPISPGERELQLLGDVRGTTVLELACGAAQNAIALAKWGAAVSAMDFSSQQLRHARTLIDREGVAVNLLRGDIERLSMFRDGRFDTVLSSSGWEFVPDLKLCLRECYRVLKPQGQLVVCTVHPLAAFEWDEKEDGLLVTDYFHPPVELWEEPSAPGEQRAVTFFRTIQEVYGLLAGSGFIVEQVLEPYPYPLPAMSEEERRAIPYWGQFWEDRHQILSRVPFTVIYKARKP